MVSYFPKSHLSLPLSTPPFFKKISISSFFPFHLIAKPGENNMRRKEWYGLLVSGGKGGFILLHCWWLGTAPWKMAWWNKVAHLMSTDREKRGAKNKARTLQWPTSSKQIPASFYHLLICCQVVSVIISGLTH